MIRIEAGDSIEAMEELKGKYLDEAIEEVVKNMGTGTCVYGVSVSYDLDGYRSDEYFKELGEFEFDLEDLEIEEADLLDKIKYMALELEEKDEEIERLKSEIRKLKSKLNEEV